MAGAEPDIVAEAAREGEPDYYLAALLAPRPARAGLLALAAFSSELRRVAGLVTREPMIGEIRLQWWRDAIEGTGQTRTGSPVADALREARDRHRLPREVLLGMIDARERDLAADPFEDENAFSGYLAAAEGGHFALAAQVVGGASSAEADRASAAAGRSYGIARLLLSLPQLLARDRLPLPPGRLARADVSAAQVRAGEADVAPLLRDLHVEARRELETARQHVAKLPRPVRVAFLPLALVEPYLRVLEKPGRDPLREIAEVAPLRRVSRIAAAHWFGRL